MGYQDDYVMRTISDLVRAIARLVLGKSDIDYDLPEDEDKYTDLDRVYKRLKDLVDEGNINDAENLLTDELLALYMSFEHVHRDDMGEYSRQEIYKLITCSIDIDNKMVMDLWKDYCREYRDVTELEFPYSPGEDLYDLESYYKMLDLYFQFSRKVGLPVQAENLAEERRSTEEEISRILRTECSSYTRKCSERGKISRGHNRSGRRRAAGNRV